MLVQALHRPSEVNPDDVESKRRVASSADCPSACPLWVQRGKAAGGKRPEERSFLPCTAKDKRKRETDVKRSRVRWRCFFSLCPLANHSRSPAVRLVDFRLQRYELIETSQISDLLAAWTF